MINKKNLFLRKLAIKDIKKDYLNWMNDPDVVKYTEQRFKKHSLKSIKKFVLSKLSSKNEHIYGIFIKKNKNEFHIGNIKIGPIDYFHKTADISYIIGYKKYWNKGLGSLAVKKIIELSRKKYRLKKITAGCYEMNKGAIEVLKKNKFIMEASFKNQINYKNKRIKKFVFGLIL